MASRSVPGRGQTLGRHDLAPALQLLLCPARRVLQACVPCAAWLCPPPTPLRTQAHLTSSGQLARFCGASLLQQALGSSGAGLCSKASRLRPSGLLLKPPPDAPHPHSEWDSEYSQGRWGPGPGPHSLHLSKRGQDALPRESPGVLCPDAPRCWGSRVLSRSLWGEGPEGRAAGRVVPSLGVPLSPSPGSSLAWAGAVRFRS